MSATLKDIAKLAGVSSTAASLVLNNKPNRLSDQTKKRILAAVEELHYQPNQIAQSLATKRTNTIGLILPDISNLFLSTLTHSIEHSADKYHYGVFLCDTNNRNDKTLDYIEILKKRCVDGIILIPPTHINEGDYPRKYAQALDNCSIPYVIVEHAIHDIFHDFVTIDNTLGGYIATQHLVDMGHRQIGCITGPLSEYGSKKRLSGYRQVLEENNIPYNPDYIFERDFFYTSGIECAGQLYDAGVTAIFAFNDLMALGAYNALEKRGLKIPDDISIIGFDNNPILNMINLSLTTVDQPYSMMGKKSFDLLLKRMEDPARQHSDYHFTPSLIQRGSVKKL